MSFANVDRSNSTNTTSNEINQNNPIRNICINPKSVDDNKKFAEEIPREFKYNNWIGKLKFWNRASRDRWAWDKIPEDAKDLDSKFDCRNPQSRITPEIDKKLEKLNSDSIDYLNKNKSIMKENDTYTDSDKEDDVIISKRALLAAKMINKLEDGNFLIDNRFEDLKEGAKNVTLLPSNTLRYSTQDLEVPEKNANTSDMMFKHCRNRELFSHEPTAADCRQGYIGDCWLQTSLIDILNKRGPEPIKKCFRDNGANVKVRLYKPKNKFTFWKGTQTNWEPRIYTVPKRIPVSRSRNDIKYNFGANWVHYLEAALAKSGIRDKCLGNNYTKKDESGNKFRDYSSICSGYEHLGWHIILGNNIKIFKMNNIIKNRIGTDGIYDKIKNAIDKRKLISIAFQKFSLSDGAGHSGGETMNRGLVANHSYSICGYEEEGGVKYINVINPWNSRLGRDYGTNGKDRGYEKSFAGIGNESFRLKFSTAMKHLCEIEVED